MKSILRLFGVTSLLLPLAAQNESFLPEVCAELPGNAAVSLPLRWSHGTMQIRVDSTMLPANFVGKTITGLRMRRPAFLFEPAYGALQRTLTVRAGFDTRPANFLTSDKATNRPTAGTTLLFGPAAVTIPATAATGPDTAVGEDLFAIQFATPLPVVAGNLFLEIEAGDAPLVVEPEHWVDAVWQPGGVSAGLAVTVGDGSCTTRSGPTELVWSGSGLPQVGGQAAVQMSGGQPTAFAITWFGLDPIPRAASPTYFGYGASLAALDPALGSCRQWAPMDAIIAGNINNGGNYSASFQLVGSVVTAGMRIGVQSAWIDDARPGLMVSVSNGLMLVVGTIDVGAHCSTVFFPGTSTVSPFNVYVGQMPVIALEHN